MTASEVVSGRRLSQLAGIGVAELRAVGPRRAAALEAMAITSVLDLLTHYPRRYVDRSASATVEELVVGEEAFVTVVVRRVRTLRPRGRRPIIEAVVGDETGELVCTFFNQAWRARQLVEGRSFIVYGRAERYRERLQMTNPIVDTSGTQTGRIVAVYPQSERAGVSSSDLASYVVEALRRAGEFADPLPGIERLGLGLWERTRAFRAIHEPETLAETFAARRRLAFDELLRLQVHLVSAKRAAARDARGIAHHVTPGPTTPDLVGGFLAGLPFTLTDAQRRVIEEIALDLGAAAPMHRLLQGDVGSGKTVVALAALLYGVQGGYETAIMVPTEVLAEQHFLAARELLGGLRVLDAGRLLGERPIRVELLTARTTERERAKILRALGRGEVEILVGTHALLTEDVRFSSLGVVVIDEQHRFGVDQRAALREKGSLDAHSRRDPDLLVMTATPIPRTAAMTVYGDLDYSVLDELPAGRATVATSWVDTAPGAAKMWQTVRRELRAGRQIYIVCPLVRAGESPEGIEDDDLLGAPESDDDESEPDEVRPVGDRLFGEEAIAGAERRAPAGAVETYERLAAGELAGARLGLLHGQMPAGDKEKTMAAFRRGEVSVLVATTVIEVGVDVANATVMVVMDADRFGIAQLHQLRGRIGRGAAASYCFLETGAVSEDARRRLEAVVRTRDGFELAEIDLELRGEGTVLGVHQKGRNDLKLASLRRDRELVTEARRVAEVLLDADPGLERNPLLADELRLFVGEEAGEYLFRS